MLVCLSKLAKEKWGDTFLPFLFFTGNLVDGDGDFSTPPSSLACGEMQHYVMFIKQPEVKIGGIMYN